MLGSRLFQLGAESNTNVVNRFLQYLGIHGYIEHSRYSCMRACMGLQYKLSILGTSCEVTVLNIAIVGARIKTE